MFIYLNRNLRNTHNDTVEQIFGIIFKIEKYFFKMPENKCCLIHTNKVILGGKK